RDGLLGLVARLGSGGLVRDALQQHIGIRLEPYRLVPVGRLGHLGHPRVLRATASRPQRIQRAVGGDAVQPGTDRPPLLKPRQAAPGGEQRLLEQILGILGRAHDPVDVQLQLTTVGIGQLAERVLVAGTRTGEGLLVHRRILAQRLPWARITGNDAGTARNSSVSFRLGARLNRRSRQQPKGASRWERSWSARTSRSTESSRTRPARRASGTAAGSSS